MQRHAVIAGGGIVGLATALELMQQQWQVTVFDRSAAMAEASRAAVGMLAGNDPENPSALQALAQLSLRLYPEFLRRVESLSGARVLIRTTRTLQGTDRLPSHSAKLDAAELNLLAPGIDPNGLHFFLLDESSFDAWDLAEALPDAARSAGVHLREHTPVLQVRAESGGVHIQTSAGSLHADVFLNATGAWAPALDASLPVFPRKGHLLTVELPGDLQTDCVLRTGEIYIVPRGGNRYTVGSSVEDAGFDRTVDPLQIQALLQKAIRLWPALANARIDATWVGFRPGSEDGLPILDATAEHCWVAAGHFRNGILLGPGTARVISQCMSSQPAEIDLTPFRAGRFFPAPLAR